MSEYKGSCHCGAITFNFTGPEIDKGLRCDCSMCRRKGATMTQYTIDPADFHYEDPEGVLSVYEFGTCTAKHYFCSRCGIYAFHQTFRVPGHYRANTGCLDNFESSNLPFDVINGSSF